MSSKREAEKDFLNLKIFVTMVFIFIGGVMVTLAHDDGIPYALFMTDRETASGTITGLKKAHRDYLLSYSFSDQNGNRYLKTKSANSTLLLGIVVGNTIEVTFFPLDPSISEVTSLVPSLKPGFWIMVIGSALILFSSVLSIFSTLQLIKLHKDDRYY